MVWPRETTLNHAYLYINYVLGKKSDAVLAEGTEDEDTQGAAGQGVRRRAANQNRGLRAQLQASRRARLARINEDEHDGMLIRTKCCTPLLIYPR